MRKGSVAKCGVGQQTPLLHGVEVYGSVPGLRQRGGEGRRELDMTSPKAKKLPAELLRVNAQSPEAEVLRYAASFLSRGSVVAVPTDTFYGLAADPFNLAAVDEIYRVKGRPETRALPILVNSVDQAILLSRERIFEGSVMEPMPRRFLRDRKSTRLNSSH